MKRVIHILVCLAIILLLGCSASTDQHVLAVCGSFGVPGMICYEMKGGNYSCNVLDTDSEGRILFEYTTYNQLVEGQTTVYVICQQHDSYSVFFYEDRCYTPNQEDVQQLKNENDWDTPLDYNKMSRRSVNITFDGFLKTGSQLKYAQVKAACCEKLGTPETAIQELCVLDVDPSGNVLYLLRTESAGVTDNFLAIVSPQYAVSVLEYDSGTAGTDSLPLFKSENGWDYSHN